MYFITILSAFATFAFGRILYQAVLRSGRLTYVMARSTARVAQCNIIAFGFLSASTGILIAGLLAS